MGSPWTIFALARETTISASCTRARRRSRATSRSRRPSRTRIPASWVGMVGAPRSPSLPTSLSAPGVAWTSRRAASSISPSRKWRRDGPSQRITGLGLPRGGADGAKPRPFRAREHGPACRSSRPVYKRDLTVENYFIGYLRHPYVSLYTGRGCRSKCTFCLWPQTIGGHRLPHAERRERRRGDGARPEASSRR